MKRLLFGSRDLGMPADLGLLVLRVVGGLSLAIAHGWGKLYPDGPAAGLIAGMQQRLPWLPQPELWGWVVGVTETVGGALIALGLLTRPAALAVTVNMAVAAFLFHAPDPFEARELALLFFAIAFTVLMTGPGRLSMDRVLLGGPEVARGHRR